MKLTLDKFHGLSNIKDTKIGYEEDDCCFGCPYKCCPSRPTKANKASRPPSCAWNFYLNSIK